MKIDGDEIIFMGDVPVQSHVDLHGDKSKLLLKQRKLRKKARASFPKEFDLLYRFILSVFLESIFFRMIFMKSSPWSKRLTSRSSVR